MNQIPVKIKIFYATSAIGMLEQRVNDFLVQPGIIFKDIKYNHSEGNLNTFDTIVVVYYESILSNKEEDDGR